MLPRETSQELAHLASAHRLWMAFAMEEDEPFDPAEITLLRAQRIVPETDYVADAVEEFDLAGLCCWG